MSLPFAARSLHRLATRHVFRAAPATIRARYALTPVLAHVRDNSNLPQGVPPGIDLDNLNFDKTTFMQSDVYKKIKGHPEAIAALANLGHLMKEKGVDLTKPPSMMTMVKLGADKGFREAMQEVMTQMTAAGLDVTKKETMEELMRAAGMNGDQPRS